METTVQFIEASSKSERTRKSYERCISHFKSWLANHSANLVLPDGSVNLKDLPLSTIKDFLAEKRSNNAGVSNLNQYRAAIKYLYSLQNTSVPSWWTDGQKDFFAGLRRLEAQERQKGERKLVPGKRPLEFSAYQKLGELLLGKDSFTHCYMVLTWNLMCRSSDTVNITLQHVDWNADAMTVLFSKSKNDQAGEFINEARHIYANVQNPSICCILSIAIYLSQNSVSSGVQIADQNMLFKGGNQQSRFSKTFHNIINENAEILGVPSTELGSHSLRKGASSFIGGFVDGPTSIAICLRAGWKMGGVQDRYFRYERAGDQFVGRVLSGLDIRTPEFGSLPPHFPSIDESISSICRKQFPELGVSSLSLCLLASLAYHSEFLVHHLPSHHPLFSTFLFVGGFLDITKSKVHVDSTHLRPTGVPGMVSLMAGFKQMESQIGNLPQRMATVLDDRDTVQSTFITKQYLNQALEGLVARIHAENNTIREGRIGHKEANAVFYWGGKYHQVPEDFKLPNCNIRLASSLWFKGDSRTRISALQKLSASDLPVTERRKYCEWQSFFRAAEQLVAINQSDAMDLDIWIAEVVPRLIPVTTERSRKRRMGELKICSASRMLRKKKS